MLSRLWRLLHRTPPALTLLDSPGDRRVKPLEDEDDGLAWLRPPADPLDVAGWDRFWLEHINHGIGPSLVDMFCHDSMLIRVMNDEGMKRILCAGNGISQEPKALAAAGMDVVALDISPQAVEIAKSYPFPLGGISNYCEPELQKPGGTVEFATGDILDSAICPGPYDVIIERLTAQNYFTRDIGTVLNGLAQRLSENGIFFSHSHDGAWKPPAKRRHYSESWFHEAGWTIWNGRPGRKPLGRVAWLFTSTG
jgi:hypothetical protein